MASNSDPAPQEITYLNIDLIKINGGTQTRTGINSSAVNDYVEAMERGAEFPPIDVYYDGTDYWLADGFHRTHARCRAKIPEYTIAAIVHQGTRRDAVLHSVKANNTHGLRRTNDDKRRAVETLLRDDEWNQWSNREIGRRCAVDEKTVRKIREDLSAELPQMQERTVNRGGTIYSQNVSNIGHIQLRQAEPEGTDTSLGEIAEPVDDAAIVGEIAEPVDDAAIVGDRSTEDIRVKVKHQMAQQIKLSPLPFPTDQFDVIVIDPPWRYELRENDPTHRGRVNYPDMSLEEIIALPVSTLTKDNCILWLWTTNSFMGDAVKCLEAWGFTLKTILTWVKMTKNGDKTRMGTGNWLRNVTEHCLFAVKGRPASPSFSKLLTNQTTVIHAPRREHSRKPDEFYSIVESLCPGSKLELFARSIRPDWTGWGAELNLFDIKETDIETD